MNILEHVGCGGIAEVFKVEDGVVYFAFKTLKHLYRNNIEARSRLHNEYKILRTLTHQNIVKCHEWTTIAGRDGILMELISGTPLADHCIDHNWSGFEILRRIIRYLQSLEPPVIHNDISTQNVLINELGQVKLIDFSSSFRLGEKPVLIARATAQNELISTTKVLDIDHILLDSLITSFQTEAAK